MSQYSRWPATGGGAAFNGGSNWVFTTPPALIGPIATTRITRSQGPGNWTWTCASDVTLANLILQNSTGTGGGVFTTVDSVLTGTVGWNQKSTFVSRVMAF